MTTTPTRPTMPPVVYVPTTDEDDRAARRLVMHTVEDGRTALGDEYLEAPVIGVVTQFEPAWLADDDSLGWMVDEASVHDALDEQEPRSWEAAVSAAPRRTC